MCENRERLIGYVYDECDPAERAEIEAHLESCHTCRQEIRGLRERAAGSAGVGRARERSDLAADCTGASRSRRGDWCRRGRLAAAACATFLVGAAGGAATYALMPQPAPAVAQASVRLQPPTATPAVTPAELAAFENKMLTRMRAELDTHARVADVAPRNVSDTTADTQRSCPARQHADRSDRTSCTTACSSSRAKRRASGPNRQVSSACSFPMHWDRTGPKRPGGR